MIIDELAWDEENVEHIGSRHGIAPDEVEDVCHGENMAEKARFGHYVVYGRTSAGRYLKIIVARLADRSFRAITAMDMTEAQKRRYRQKGK